MVNKCNPRPCERLQQPQLRGSRDPVSVGVRVLFLLSASQKEIDQDGLNPLRTECLIKLDLVAARVSDGV